MQTKAYSDYLSSVGALIGVPTSRISTELAAVLEVHFNAAMRKGWKSGNWLDISPYGEARFVGNRLTYPNDLSQTANWTATAATVTAASLANPLDGRVTASKVMETVANSAHNVAQTFTCFPSESYLVSVYARRNGRDDIRVAVSDGVTTFSCFYDLAAGTTGTSANTDSTTITAQANGYYLCQFTFTAGSGATGGTLTLSLSSDGSTLSYAGDTAKGAYVWGALVQQTTNVGQQDSLVAWDQTGENEIDAVFSVWGNPPTGATPPRDLAYELTPNGIQIVGTGTGWVAGYFSTVLNGPTVNPVFLYYRKTMPGYTGDTFDATATYAVDEQAYYTADDGLGNFYKCLSATSAGEDPDDTPAKWELLTIPEPLFQFAVYQAYGDWLMSDGQQDKAAGVYMLAQSKMDDSYDVQERQMGHVQPMRVSTHITSRY